MIGDTHCNCLEVEVRFSSFAIVAEVEVRFSSFAIVAEVEVRFSSFLLYRLLY